jgi:NADPH-dependent 2,4-dienoyl-CoA reductase/sulfur reductase-like enzyme
VSVASPQRIVVVGASLAGLRAGQAVRSAGHDGELTIIGEEPHRPYNRPPLSKDLLARRVGVGECDLDHADLEADWVLGLAATGVDRRARRLRLEGGEELPYDRLIVATGAKARSWRGPGEDLKGVMTLRTLDDSLRLGATLGRASSLAVVGAGFVGCEVAATARGLGVAVTMIDVAPLPLAPLGAAVGEWCADLHQTHGVDLRTGVGIDALVGDGALEAIRLTDGSLVECEVAVLALGAIPNGEWLSDSGASLKGGSLICDATLTAAGDPDILGAGDVVAWPHPLVGGDLLRVEHWSNAVEQGTTAGRNAMRKPGQRQVHQSIPSFWSDQFGHRVQSVGLPGRAEQVHVLEGSPAGGSFLAAGFAAGRLISAVCVDAAPRLRHYRRALADPPALDAVLAGEAVPAAGGAHK